MRMMSAAQNLTPKYRNKKSAPKQILKLIFEVDFEEDVVIITLKR